jgi:hypothetical protein
MAVASKKQVIDERNVQNDTRIYEYALHRAIMFMLCKSSADSSNLAENLIAIRKHLLTPKDNLTFREWLLTWARELYSPWAVNTVESELRNLNGEASIGNSKPGADCLHLSRSSDVWS